MGVKEEVQAVAILNENDVLIGVFHDCSVAEGAYHELRRGGFPDEQIRVSLCEVDLPVQPRITRSGILAGLFAGAVIGGLIGLIVAWLAAGFLLAILLVAGECAALGAGLGALSAWAIARDEARCGFPTAVHLSQGVVTVRPGGRVKEAADILRRCTKWGAFATAALERPH
jgi:hypothetical protein